MQFQFPLGSSFIMYKTFNMILICFCLLKIGNLFDSRRSTIINLYNGAFDSSSALFLIIKVTNIQKVRFCTRVKSSRMPLSLLVSAVVTWVWRLSPHFLLLSVGLQRRPHPQDVLPAAQNLHSSPTAWSLRVRVRTNLLGVAMLSHFKSLLLLLA